MSRTQSLEKSLAGVAQPLPIPWGALAKAITPGPGHLVLAIAAANTGKSALALAWALAVERPPLLLSMDTDLATQASRTLAYITGHSQDDIRANPEAYAGILKQNEDRLPMMMDYPVYADEVDDVCKAYGEFYGENPQFIVIDNLKDVVRNESYEAYREALRTLHRLAKRRSSTILILHHINRKFDGAGEGDKAPRLSDGQFTGEQDCEIVLGLWQGQGLYGSTTLMLRVLKNRFGRKHVDVGLLFDMQHMAITERGAA